MPLMDGLELVRRVRRDLRDVVTPIVLISTLGTPEDVQRGKEAGATDYILKPLSPHHIKAALRKLLDG
jgi:PleD family two-component response regulator